MNPTIRRVREAVAKANALIHNPHAPGLSSEEVALVVGISPQRVREIESVAKAKIARLLAEDPVARQLVLDLTEIGAAS